MKVSMEQCPPQGMKSLRRWLGQTLEDILKTFITELYLHLEEVEPRLPIIHLYRQVEVVESPQVEAEESLHPTLPQHLDLVEQKQ